MKKTILLLSVILLPAAGFAQSGTAGSLTWSLSGGTLTISGNGAMPDYSPLNYPAFGMYTAPWFDYGESVTAVIIGNGVTRIGDYAFSWFENLTSVTVPGNVTSIGEGAFEWCFSLASITLPNKVTSIGMYAFSSAALTSITIPGSVTSIGEVAFGGCDNLSAIHVDAANRNYSSEDGVLFNRTKTVLTCYPAGKSDVAYSIPSSVTGIENRAFYFCRKLTSITLPGGVTDIGEEAFIGCKELSAIHVDAANRNYSSENGVLFNRNKSILICYPAGKSGAYDIPASVTDIGEDAFYSCESLTSITIPGSVTNIGEDAFYSCERLTAISIPQSVTGIGNWAFAYCSGLTDVTVEWAIPLLIPDYVFDDVPLNTLTLHVPSGTKQRYEVVDVWKDFGTITDSPSGSVLPELAVEATCRHGVLSVNTPKAEQIEVYSAGGQLLFTARKDGGKATFDIGRLPRGVLIVRGSSGWGRKTINN